MTSFDDGLDGLPLECVNCRKESHLFGIFCWWGVLISFPVLIAYIGLIGWMIYDLV